MTHAERIRDIRERPENHKHADLNALMQCCMTQGAIDISVMEAHEGLVGHNAGKGCDVLSGPCSCGSTH